MQWQQDIRSGITSSRAAPAPAVPAEQQHHHQQQQPAPPPGWEWCSSSTAATCCRQVGGGGAREGEGEGQGGGQHWRHEQPTVLHPCCCFPPLARPPSEPPCHPPTHPPPRQKVIHLHASPVVGHLPPLVAGLRQGWAAGRSEGAVGGSECLGSRSAPPTIRAGPSPHPPPHPATTSHTIHRHWPWNSVF